MVNGPEMAPFERMRGDLRSAQSPAPPGPRESRDVQQTLF
jgi:hypothetical protein